MNKLASAHAFPHATCQSTAARGAVGSVGSSGGFPLGAGLASGRDDALRWKRNHFATTLGLLRPQITTDCLDVIVQLSSVFVPNCADFLDYRIFPHDQFS